jgi:hypothetical protein
VTADVEVIEDNESVSVSITAEDLRMSKSIPLSE